MASTNASVQQLPMGLYLVVPEQFSKMLGGRGVTAVAQSPQSRERRHSRRGRQAGKYFVTGPPPKTMTDSIARVYKTLKTHAKGLSAQDVSGRLGMPSGTVSWSLQKLRQSRAVKHTMPGEAAQAAERSPKKARKTRPRRKSKVTPSAPPETPATNT